MKINNGIIIAIVCVALGTFTASLVNLIQTKEISLLKEKIKVLELKIKESNK